MTTHKQRLTSIMMATVLFAFALFPVAPVRAGQFPATGQTPSYPADNNDGINGLVAVPDDGALRRGAPLRYKRLNDGTVKDLNTGLIWEVKCAGESCPALHFEYNLYPWSGDGSTDTIWDWLDQVNAEGGTGYAGHHDWRIPNVRELQSIVDYGEFDPAISPIFGPTFSIGCFWSSTTSAADPSNAWLVCLDDGQESGDIDGNKTYSYSVRTVRGGPPAKIRIPKVPLN